MDEALRLVRVFHARQVKLCVHEQEIVVVVPPVDELGLKFQIIGLDIDLIPGLQQTLVLGEAVGNL